MKKIFVLKILCFIFLCFLVSDGFGQPTQGGVTANCSCENNIASPYSDNELVFRTETILAGTDEQILFGNFGGTVTGAAIAGDEKLFIYRVQFNFGSPFANIEDAHNFYECGNINPNTGSGQNRVRAADFNYHFSMNLSASNSSSGLNNFLDSNFDLYPLCTFSHENIPAKTSNIDDPIEIAIVDSGYDNILGLEPVISYSYSYDFVQSDIFPNDETESNHGTLVGGLVAYFSLNNYSDVKITPVKVIDSSMSSSYFRTLEGIIHSIKNDADLINLSLGGLFCPSDLCTIVFNDIAKTAEEYNIAFVAAAGNLEIDIDQCYYFPGSCTEPNVLVIGSSNCNNQFSTFSNFGENNVDLACPGENIQSLIRDSTVNGTSFSAPFVTAVAAGVAIYQPNADYFDYACVFDAIKNTVTYQSWDAYCATGGSLNTASALLYDCFPTNYPDNNQKPILANSEQKEFSPYFLSTDQLTVTIESSVEQKVFIEVITISGEVVAQSDWPLTKGRNNIKLNGLDHLPSGIYLVSALIGGEIITTKCFKY